MKLLVAVLFCFLVDRGQTERVKGKIYVDIDTGNRAACFRRLNGTSQIGCTSDPKGNVGVVYYINKAGDLEWLLDSGPHKPYAVLMNADYFTMDILGRLKASGKVNGVMVIHLDGNNTETLSPVPASFSPDKSCPNSHNGLYAGSSQYGDCQRVEWNPDGQDMMFQDLGFPVFILTDKSDVTFIIESCYEKFNLPHKMSSVWDYALCAVELKDRMDGAKDSETCYRRSMHQTSLYPENYCDPLGDSNVYATVKAINTSTTRKDRSVIIAAARLDSFSMFEDVYPSADNHVSGIVAMLAAAEVIGKVKEDIQESDTDILFTFLQGEAFDYIGSGRMVYDMMSGDFPPRSTATKKRKVSPINLGHISHFVEVNQVGHRDQGKLWIHTDPLSRMVVSSQIDKMIQNLRDIDSGLVDEADQSDPLPPASVQSFLKKTIKNPFPSVVITDHKKQFTNKYYNSRFDVASSINVQYPANMSAKDKYDYITPQAASLTNVATLLAKFLYKTATGKTDMPSSLIADNSTVTRLLYCLLISPKCELFKQNLRSEDAKLLADKPYPFYVGVYRQTNPISHVSLLVHNVLFRYLGDVVENKTEDTCHDMNKDSNDYFYKWLQGPCTDRNCNSRVGQCLQATANVSKAMSIAFEDGNDDYDFKSGEYSTWTESSWATDAMNVRLFLIPNKRLELVTLLVGVAMLLVSLLGAYGINRKVDVLFAQRRPSRRY